MLKKSQGVPGEGHTSRKLIITFIIVLLISFVLILLLIIGTWVNRKEIQDLEDEKNKLEDTVKSYENYEFVSGGENRAIEAFAPGTVYGKLCYPSEYLPPGEIFAKDVETGDLYYIEYKGTETDEGAAYTMELSPGDYVFRYQAYYSEEDPELFSSGYYTKCATSDSFSVESCGEGSHELITVSVEAGETVKNIDLCDFYYGEGEEPEF